MRQSALQRPGWFACFLLVAAIAIFWLPFHVAVTPSISLSYLFGFNNRVAMAAVLLGACGIALSGPSLVPVRAAAPPARKPLSRSTLAKAISLVLATNLCFLVLVHRLDGYNESIYTVHRVGLLLHGLRPYRDFEFAYGPLLLYGPAALVKLTGFSVANAALCFWILVNLLSVWQLYTVLGWIEPEGSSRRRIFLLLFALSLFSMFSLGTSYSLLRFLTPGFLAMSLHRLFISARSEPTRAATLLLVIPGCLLALSISPEGGLAFTMGTLLYLALFCDLRRNPWRLGAFLVTVAAIALVLGLVQRAGMFSTLTAFRTGGSNYPVVPAPHLLLFLVAVGISASYLGQRLRLREGSALAALCVVSFAQVPAALGRCDVLHVWMNGVGLFVCAMALCEHAQGAARYFTRAAAIVLFLLPALQGFRTLVSYFTDPVIAYCVQPEMAAGHPALVSMAVRAATLLHGPAKGAARVDSLRRMRPASEIPDIPALFQQPPNTVFVAPFGFFGGHTAPLEGPNIARTYFLATVNMATPQDTQRVIGELVAHPTSPFLQTPGAIDFCVKSPESATGEMRSLFTFPFRARPRHAGDTLEPLCSYIRTHYVLSQPASDAQRGYELWLPSSKGIPQT